MPDVSDRANSWLPVQNEFPVAPVSLWAGSGLAPNVCTVKSFEDTAAVEEEAFVIFT